MILARNLKALALSSPKVAEAIGDSAPRGDIDFLDTPEGLTARDGSGRLVASGRAPRAEGARLAGTIDIMQCAAVFALGFGLGYHLESIGRRLGFHGVVCVYEPDVALLRAVLERFDHSAWMRKTNLFILTDPTDEAGLSAALQPFQHYVVLGSAFLTHPASAARIGDTAAAFRDMVLGIVRSIRTSVVTSFCISRQTIQNGLMNLDHYTGTAGARAELTSCA